MKAATYLLLLALPFVVGCNSLKKITEGAESTPPAPYRTSVSGTLQGQYECVSVDGMNPSGPFQVFLNGSLVASTDYKYLKDAHRICFKNKVTYLPSGIILIDGPVSNAGDHYRITAGS